MVTANIFSPTCMSEAIRPDTVHHITPRDIEGMPSEEINRLRTWTREALLDPSNQSLPTIMQALHNTQELLERCSA